MTVNLLWNKPIKLHGRTLQPFSIEVLPKLNIDFAELGQLIPAKTRIFIPHLPKTTVEIMIATVRSLKMAGFEPIPHIAARRIANAFELKVLLAALYEQEVQELLLIAGSVNEPAGEYKQCIDLLDSEAFMQFRFKRLLFAGHPEGHPKVSREQIEAALLKKIDWANRRGYETAIVTQFCFNVQAIRQWIQKIREANIAAPIYIGLAGPASFRTLLHYAAICGVSDSTRQFIKQPIQLWNLFLNGDPKHLINALIKQPEIRAQITGFHLFPFGGINKTIQWAEDFSKSEQIYSSL